MLLVLAALAGPPSLADAVASGDCTTVVDGTAGPEPVAAEWRVPRAWCLLKLGDAKGAEAMLASGTGEGVLGEYGRLVLARARLQLGDTAGADTALDGLSLPGDAGTEVRMSRARLAVQRKDLAGFRKVVGSDSRTEVGFLYGEVLLAAGEREKAIGQWRAVWTSADVGGWDAKAEARLAEVGADPMSDTERGSRLTNLRKKGRIDEAAVLAAELGTDAKNPLELARVNLQARKYADSLTHWRAALGPPAEAKGSAQNLFDYALTNARNGDYTTAAVVYERVIAQHPTDDLADFASFKLGYMAYDELDCARAVPLFEDHTKRYPGSSHLDEALWFTARCHWREGRVEPAVAAWTDLGAKRPKSSLVPGAAYWRARAHGRTDPAAEKAALERVVSTWPTSGYAWFAAQRLGKTFEAHPPVDRPAWPASLASRTDVKRAEALLAVGFRDWARDELAPVKPALSGREAALAGAWAFIAAGDYRTGQALAKPFCVSPWKGGDPVAQQACTPRPEAGIVERIARRFELDPLLPFGIMTAESALKPDVTSVAGARGLMQLMPLEGPRIHEQIYAGRPYDADDLYSAPYNASMGTAELGLKRQSLKGVLAGTDLPAVIASYNGGEEAVRRWLTAYDGPPEFDEFSEDVGYTETRKYVKRVLGYVMAYRWVYGDG
ncbi:MAG: transglycosylase SLT domain-containing protein [Myxococcota bacterium]